MLRRLALCCIALFCYAALAESQLVIVTDCNTFPNAVVGQAYSQSFLTSNCTQSSGGGIGGIGSQCMVMWSMSTPIPGLFLASSPTATEIGILSGTPTAAGDYDETITATDINIIPNSVATRSCTIHVVVSAGGVPPEYNHMGNNINTYLVGHSSGRDSGGDGGTSCATSAAAPMTGGLALGAAFLAGVALFLRRFLK